MATPPTLSTRRGRRGLRALAWLAALALALPAAAAAGGYLFLRRSLPPREGTVAVPGLRAPVTVRFDARGVPHIVAEHEADLFLAQGYVTARDRLFQMDLTRRAAAGRLAEVFGPSLLDTDRWFRTLTLRRAAEASLAAQPPEVRAVLEAYAAGVNAYIEEATRAGRLPPEFALLRYRPEPWRPEDTLSIGKLMAWELGGNWEQEVWNYLAARRAGADRLPELLPSYPEDAPTIVAALAEEGLRADGLLARIRPGGEDLGSNNWVLSGRRTASGKPLLANDPHLRIGLPGIWYQVHLALASGDLDVIGATFPGVPGVVIGHNRHVAWGFTNVGADVQDLYAERPHPSDPYLFEYDGRYERATVYREEIRVRGRAEPVPLEVVVTRHGPLIHGVLDAGGGERPDVPLALRWTALMSPATEPAAILGMNRARDWREFREALRYFQAPPQNVVFGSADGTIAYRAQGLIPIRRRGDGLLPVPGWTSQYEWSGFIPFEQLPEVVNPPEGFIATANHRVAGEDYPYLISATWAPPYRAARIREVLAGASGWGVREMQALQTDAANLQARALLPALLPAARRGLEAAGGATEPERRALALLEAWDRVDRADSGGAAVWHAFYRQLIADLLVPVTGEDLFRRMPAARQVADRLLLQAAGGRMPSWLRDRDLDALAAGALRAAAADLARLLGPRPERWRWGDLHRVTFAHPLASVPALAPLLNVGPFTVDGSAVAVLATGFSHADGFAVTSGPAWRQVVDLADPAGNSWDVAAPGQSGHRLSPHYADQAGPWVRGEYGPMLMRPDDLAGAPVLRLVPAGSP